MEDRAPSVIAALRKSGCHCCCASRQPPQMLGLAKHLRKQEQDASAPAPAQARPALSELSLNERLDFLQTVHLFSDWPEEKLRQLAPLLTKHTYESGSYIIDRGDQGGNIHMLRRGRCRAFVSRSRASMLAEDTVLSFEPSKRRTDRSRLDSMISNRGMSVTSARGMSVTSARGMSVTSSCSTSDAQDFDDAMTEIGELAPPAHFGKLFLTSGPDDPIEMVLAVERVEVFRLTSEAFVKVFGVEDAEDLGERSEGVLTSSMTGLRDSVADASLLERDSDDDDDDDFYSPAARKHASVNVINLADAPGIASPHEAPTRRRDSLIARERRASREATQGSSLTDLVQQQAVPLLLPSLIQATAYGLIIPVLPLYARLLLGETGDSSDNDGMVGLVVSSRGTGNAADDPL